ncbi:MAG: RNA 2',3'-cyclic phosphodiesterase [Candidatus Cloacimonadota bacterium]|nr:RNA 2',3'-cyclic phosphodiesterase [Candidatus Cloacimonadota bacterium]
MRTFLALELPKEIKDYLSELTRELAEFCTDEVKWVSRENLHITLQFIGKTHPEDIKEISAYAAQQFQKIEDLQMHSPNLQIIPARRPKIIWVSLQTENKELFKAAKRIGRRLEQLGYEIDRRPLKLHVTLGRVKKRLPEKVVNFTLTKEIEFSKLKVPGLTLYRSYLKPTGPEYEKLVEIPKE